MSGSPISRCTTLCPAASRRLAAARTTYACSVPSVSSRAAECIDNPVSDNETPGARPGVSLSLTGLSMHSAARLDTLGTEQAYVVLAAARRLEAAGHKVVHLEIGEPDTQIGRASGRG